MTEPEWSKRARGRIEGQRFVVVGIGVDQMRGFIDAGADVVGAVAVLPAGGPAPVFDEVFPVLVVQGARRDILEHVVAGYASAIACAEVDIARFLDHVDPDHEATVASYLPLPHTVLGSRRVWAADSHISTRLEAKVGGATPLAESVPVIPTVPLPSGNAGNWWQAMCQQLETNRLVVQVGGVSGGGTGTFICDEPEEVPLGIEGFVSPFVDGLPGNVMGVVDDAGATLVLPASRQLLRSDAQGRPLYAGNVTGEHWASDVRFELGHEVRAIGTMLASKGFFGPFGVDFIADADGRRWYHDLNPRMNGVLDSVVHIMGDSPDVPLTALMLSRPRWTAADIDGLEDQLHRAAGAAPLARLWLTTVLDASRHIAVPPRAGRYLIAASGEQVTYLDEAESLSDDGDCGGDTIGVLQPLLPPDLALVAGDRLALGNLYCSAAFGDELSAVGPALIDAFLA